jgi:hypothetical protein
VATAKGSIFVHTKKFVATKRGPQAWPTLLGQLPAEDRQTLEGPMAGATWYPVGLWNRLMRKFVAANGGEVAIELSRYIAAEDLNFIFRMLLKMGSPEFVLKRVSAIYLRYFEAGALTATENSPRDWTLKLDAPREENGGPGEVVCTYGVCGWITEALARTGAKKPQVVHTRCRFRNAPACEYHVTWTP